MINTVLDAFEITLGKYPDAPAFEDENSVLTFQDLFAGSQVTASALAAALPPRTPVLVYMPKSPEMIRAFLGVLYAGCYYIPADTDMPAERLAHIIETSRAEAVIVSHSVSLPTDLFSDRQIYYAEDLVCGETEGSVDRDLLMSRRSGLTDMDPAYAIFTSGSTGMPKGVLIRHASLLKLAQWFVETFGIDSSEIIANQNAFFFDGSVKEIYGTLISGAHMYIVPRKLFSLPARLIEYLNEINATLINWMPSILCMIVKFRTFRKVRPETVRKVLFAGEVMPVPQFLEWHRTLPEALFANLYGPTEATVDSTYYIADNAFIEKCEAALAADPEGASAAEGLSIPIGRPCCNTDVFLLDDCDKRITKAGEAGEICIRGTCLSPGYLNDPARTAEVFVQNPLNTGYAELIYRTGDYARYNEEGELVFIGRRDSQIKHMDHRIELGEIEEALSRLQGVGRACAVYDARRGRIIAFFEASGDEPDDAGGTDPAELTAGLSKILPAYMLPKKLVRLSAIPLTPGGKTDRQALLNMYSDN